MKSTGETHQHSFARRRGAVLARHSTRRIMTSPKGSGSTSARASSFSGLVRRQGRPTTTDRTTAPLNRVVRIAGALAMLIGSVGGALVLRVTPAAAATSGSAYVALGDSFSAGQGISTYQAPVDPSATDSTKPSGANCYQSSDAYPALVANRFHLASNFTFAACGGATTEALFAPQVFKHLGEKSDGIQKAQVSYLGSNTKLVTLSIGGDNNFTSFGPQVANCVVEAFLRKSCDASIPSPQVLCPPKGSCSSPPTATAVSDAISKFKGNLVYAYQQILAKAPNAQVYVLNYPNLFPSQIASGSTCDRFLGATPLRAFGVESFLNSDFKLFQHLTSQLDQIIAQAVISTGGTRLHLVNIQKAFAGHEACTASPAVNGIGTAVYQAGLTKSFWGTLIPATLFADAAINLTASGDGLLVSEMEKEGAPFHPNKFGNALMAIQIDKQIAHYGIGLGGGSGTPQFLQLPGSTSQPLGVAQDASGNIWLTDAATNDVVELPAGSTTFVSYPLGVPGASPTGIAVDQSGNVWVTDKGAGAVTELVKADGYAPKTYTLSSGASPNQLSVDPYGNVWVAEGSNGNIGEISPSGAIREWNVGQDPEGMVTDQLGNVWVVDEASGVLEIVPSQLPAPSTSVAASSGVYPVQGTTGGTEQIALAPSGNLWFTEWGPPVLGEIIPSNSNPNADQVVVAQNYPASGGAPSGIGVDPAGNVWVEDAESQSIYKFTPSSSVSLSSGAVSGAWRTYSIGRQISTYAEGDEGNNLAVTPDGNVYFSGYSNDSPVTGYLGLLQGAATAASAGEIDGTTTKKMTIGGVGNQLTIPAGDVVTTTGGTPFVGSIPAPVHTATFIPPSKYGGAVTASAFSISPVLSGGLVSHLTFSKPVTIRYSFMLPSGVTPAEAEASTVWYFDPVTGHWLEAGTKAGDPGGSVTVADGIATITVVVTHLTSFELLSGTPTTPKILTVSPDPTNPGNLVVVSGSALGSSPGTASLALVGSAAPSIALTVSSWSPSTAQIQIPKSLSPGKYILTLDTASGLTTNALGIMVDPLSFTGGSPVLPTTTTDAATSVSSGIATLNGSVNPNGYPTTYQFQYGTTTSYGSVTTPTSAGAGTVAVSTTADLTGLLAGTTYDFRVVATSVAGTAVGANLTFITAAQKTTPPVSPTPPATCGAPNQADVIVSAALDPTVAGGYWDVYANGCVAAHGGASFFGEFTGSHLNKPVVGMAVTPGGHGYWEVASDGGVFSFGTAAFYGSGPQVPTASATVQIVERANGIGYDLLQQDGNIRAFRRPLDGYPT